MRRTRLLSRILMLFFVSGLALSCQPASADESHLTTNGQELGEISDAVERYDNLLEDTYAHIANGKQITDKSYTLDELQIAESQVDYIVDAFLSSGLTINDVDVTSTIESIIPDAEGYHVSAEVTTKINHQHVNENNLLVQDTCWWTDSHTLIISRTSVQSPYQEDGSASSQLLEDTRIPESIAPAEPNSRLSSSGMTTEEALAARVVNFTPSDGARPAGRPVLPDFMNGVRYALKWTDYPYSGDDESDFNPDYPYFGNNCANFVSQSLHEGGAPYHTSLSINTKDKALWTPNLLPGKPTWTWNNADYNYEFMKNNYFNAFDSPWMDIGGLIYTDWNADGTKDHAMIVTQCDKTFVNGQMIMNTYISQKTNNRHNIPLSVEMGLTHQSHPNTIWYGLGLRWQS